MPLLLVTERVCSRARITLNGVSRARELNASL